MKKTTILLLLVYLFTLGTLIAQENKIKDHSTSPNLYFLYKSEIANSSELLPPPPEVNSILFLNDKAQYEWGLLQRNTPRGEQAIKDADIISGDGLSEAFSEAFGFQISKDKTPEIYKLISNMIGDVADLSTRDAKKYYMRVRPFMMYGDPTCTPDQDKLLATDGSYPSGHTALGWGVALVLAEINNSRQTEILERGYQIGQSRVICGCHFQSDVDAGRIVASAAVASLHANERFMEQLEKAKVEFYKLTKIEEMK